MIIKISERISELRERYKISQNKLALCLKVTRSSVNAWEMGISIPTIENLIELANYFNVSTDYLLGLTDDISIKLTNLNQNEIDAVLNVVQAFVDNKKDNK